MNQNGEYLLDTNIVIGMFAEDRAIEEKVQNTEKLFWLRLWSVNFIMVRGNPVDPWKI